jgi:competence protein ComEC
MVKKSIKFALFILGILSFLNILAWIAVFEISKPQFLEVHFFDVGQGDAIFIETPQSHQILIDGGPTSAILEKLGKEMPFWDRSIDLVILTHPERDHLAGLIEVLEKYKVENILWTGVVRDTAEFKEWQRLIQEEGAKIFIAKAGQKIITPQTFLEILYPFESLEGKEFRNSNNTSIVSKLKFNKNSFLFTGDIYKSAERKIIDEFSEEILNSDILKVAHHGSKTSSSSEFLQIVSPEIAIIQVGKNKYGHPHQEVLERLRKFGIKIQRTDKDGDIRIISDGKNYKYGISNF